MLIDDIENVMFRHPDPEATRQFLLDYSLIDLERGGDVIYMRAYGDAPFCYVTSKGDAACSAADAGAARENRLVLRDARDEAVGAHLQG